MDFENAKELMAVYAEGSTAWSLGKAIGISTHAAEKLAQAYGHRPMRGKHQIPGLEHLPGLPAFATTRVWAGGTIYRIDCEAAGDSPGYRSLLIHLSATSQDDTDDSH